ncbi:MAG: Crp/Fnr family transcriptional regulator [Cyclobacteriaceae bacterium]|nr:Crp/Fnr family transcriptional regulator [Cyclobacteriaceae bacterium]
MNSSIEKLRHFLSTATHIPIEKVEIEESVLTETSYKKNQYILSEGSVCNSVIFIVSGLIRSYYLKDGLEVNTGFYKENDIACSFNSLVNRVPSNEFLQALENTTAIVLPYESLLKLYSTSDQWQEIGRIMTERECVYLANRVTFLSFESARTKYLNLLKEQPELVNRVPVHHLASYIGVSRETLSRIRSGI